MYNILFLTAHLCDLFSSQRLVLSLQKCYLHVCIIWVILEHEDLFFFSMNIIFNKCYSKGRTWKNPLGNVLYF